METPVSRSTHDVPDVLVIGAGAVGLASALALAESGRSVHVLDAGRIGGGSSHGNCGTITPSHAPPLAAPGMVLRALSMMLRPELVDAQRAYDLGLFEELVPADAAGSALDRAMAIAREIAGRSPHAVAHIKALVRQTGAPVTMDGLRDESRRFALLLQTDEARTGLAGAAAAHRQERGK